MCSHINVGFGLDLSIKLLKNLIYKLIQYIGNIEFDMTEKYDVKKLFNHKKILSLGLKPKHFCVVVLQKAYKVFLAKKI